MKNGKENLADTFERLDRIAQHKEVPNQGYAHNLKQQIAAAEERGRNFQPGYIREINAATERGRAAMEAAKRGERNFPPARQVVK
jgi:hypothetical protein